MSGWQPIATAPKDGTKVLIWAEVWDMTWDVQIARFSGGEWHCEEGSVSEDEEDGPTHWHAIPKPPDVAA